MSATTSRDLQGAFSKLDGIGFQVVTEGGSSVTGLQNLQRGTIDVAMTMADVAYLAFAGQLDHTAPPFDHLRGMAVVNLNTLHLVVAKGVPLGAIRDLKGLRVALGPPGSATALIAELLLEAHGIHVADVRSKQLAYVETAELLTRGEMDAAFMTQVPPSQAVTTATKAGARLIDIEGPVIEDLRTRYPYLKRTLIPQVTYPNQTGPVRTIGVDLLLVCRADVDDEVVYRLLDAYFATRPATTADRLRARTGHAHSPPCRRSALLPPARALAVKVESVIAWGGWLTALLAVAVCLGIATLLGFGYRATREWQRSAETADRARHRGKCRPAGHGRDARHARRALERAREPRLGRALARIADRHERSSRHGLRAVSVPGIVLQLAAATAIRAWSSSTVRTASRRGCSRTAKRSRYPVVLVTNPPGADALRERVEAFSAAQVPLCGLRHDPRR